MRRYLLAALAALMLSVAAPAQRYQSHPGLYPPPPPEPAMENYVAAREKLIQRYVLTLHYAWGVSISGDEDVFTGNANSWLTVYLYRDSITSFAADFDKFGTINRGGSLGIDGITVVVEVIDRPKR